MELLLDLEPLVRAGVFVAVAMVLAGAAWRWPRRLRRPLVEAVPNVCLFLVNTGVTRWVSASSVVGVAVLAGERGWGLFNDLTGPGWLAVAVSVLLMDLGLYLQHLVLHRVGWLWRLHAVHHADTAFDLTTGVRFHTGEILVSLTYKAALVVALGAPPLAVLIFEVLLSSASLFSHSNLRFPTTVDVWLRGALVTPDMHRIHHGIGRDEHDRNYGFLLSWWDRLFRTYRREPRVSHEDMEIGLAAFRDRADQRLTRLFLQPFVRIQAE